MSTGVGCHFLLQGVFPTQGSNPGLLHCRQMLYHLSFQGSPQGPLRMVLNLFCSCSINGKTKPRWQHIYSWYGLLNNLSPLLRPTAQKKIPFDILLLTDNASGHLRALMEMYSEIHVVFMPAGTASIMEVMDQGMISSFKSYYLRHFERTELP